MGIWPAEKEKNEVRNDEQLNNYKVLDFRG